MIWGLGNPAGVLAWDEMKTLFHPEFRSFVDELRNELSWEGHPCTKIVMSDPFFEKLAGVLDP